MYPGPRPTICVALLMLGSLLFPHPLPAALIRGPYLQVRTTTNIVVRWRTDQPENSRVNFGPAASNLPFTSVNPAITTEHEVVVSPLEPETQYFYSIGNSSQVLLANTNLFFRTAPPVGSIRPTRIWFISDYGFTNVGEALVRDSYLKLAAETRPADVWLTGGDNDQIDGSDARYQFSVFQYYASMLQNTPVWPTLGNHDTWTVSSPGPYPYFDNFTMPTNGEAGGVASWNEHYYSFDYANVHFISLDSVMGSLSSATNTPMTEWLHRDLAQNRQRWTIAYWHGPPYCTGTHDSDNPYDTSAYLVQMRENVVPILEKFGVDLVLGGHSHFFQRSCFLHGHYGYSYDLSATNKIDAGNGQSDGTGAYLKPDGYPGSVYVVCGVSGSPPDWEADHVNPVHLFSKNNLGSCLIDVNGNRLDFQFLCPTSSVLDHFTILKQNQTASPAVPARLTAHILDANQIQLTWANTPTNELGFQIEHSDDGTNYTLLARLGANQTVFVDTRQALNSTNYYRVRSWNDAGASPYSNTAIVGMLVPPTLVITREGDGHRLQFDGLPNTTYRVLVSSTLGTNDWEVLTSVTADQYGACDYLDEVPGILGQKYYRVVYP